MRFFENRLVWNSSQDQPAEEPQVPVQADGVDETPEGSETVIGRYEIPGSVQWFVDKIIVLDGAVKGNEATRIEVAHAIKMYLSEDKVSNELFNSEEWELLRQVVKGDVDALLTEGIALEDVVALGGIGSVEDFVANKEGVLTATMQKLKDGVFKKLLEKTKAREDEEERVAKIAEGREKIADLKKSSYAELETDTARVPEVFRIEISAVFEAVDEYLKGDPEDIAELGTKFGEFEGKLKEIFGRFKTAKIDELKKDGKVPEARLTELSGKEDPHEFLVELVLVEAEAAQPAVAPVVDPAVPGVTPPATTPPSNPSGVYSTLKEIVGEKLAAFATLIITMFGLEEMFGGMFGGGDDGAQEAVREELDAKRAELVTSFKGVVDELHSAGTLPGDITVDETDVGLLQSQGIDSADKLKTSLKSKSIPVSWHGGSLRDYVDALDAPVASQRTETPVAGTDVTIDTDDTDDAENSDTTDTGAVASIPTAPEAEKTKPPVSFRPREGANMKETSGTCEVSLDSGESIVADREYICIGNKKFKIETEQSLLVSTTWLPVQVDRIIPNDAGGCVLNMSTVTGGIEEEVPLTQAKITDLVKTLSSRKNENEILYDAPKKKGGTRKLKLTAVA